MKFKNKDEYVDFFCKYLQFKVHRGDDISLGNIGWQLEQASWVADILIGLFWALIKKNILNKKDLAKIFWHGSEE